jgi:hypothetical protein
MRSFGGLFLTFALGAAFSVDFSSDSKEKPIQKVVRLMKEMQSQLDKEAEADEDMYEKLGCWCDTNEKAKTKANAINNQKVADLSATIEEFTAKSASLKTDLEELDKQVAASTASLAESTAIREKEAAEFHASELDAIQNIESLKGALMALGKVHGEASLAQLDQQSLAQVKQLLKHHLEEHMAMFENSLTLEEQKAAMNFAANPTAFLQEDAPQSGAILGILKQMKESFETNLASSQKDETNAKATFDEMKASKNKEISSAQELIDSKKAELAETDEKNAQSKEDLEDTSATIAADTEFLANLKDKCDSATADYVARSKVRNEEIKAVAEAMDILNGDEARDLLLKFVQVSSLKQTRMSASREHAAKYIQAAAKKLNKPQLSQLAVKIRLDAFTKVKASIDEMITALKKTQADEVKQKDFCNKEFHENDMKSTEKTNLKEDLKQALADLETSKATLADEIAAIKASITETHTEMKRAVEIRLAENTEFQMTITDQRATQEILAKALDRLKAFYAKESFLQVGRKGSQPGYKKNAGASSVMSMIDHIIEESKQEEKDTIKAENDANAAYNEFNTDASASVESMSKAMNNKAEELAKVDENHAKATGQLRATEADLLSLLKYLSELHTTCDFLIKYFDVRQTKRGEEIEALQQAKAIFSGAF